MTGGEDLELLARYQECFQTLLERALDENASLDLIDRVKQSLEAR